jgi:outer membrane protein assembly factor BamB
MAKMTIGLAVVAVASTTAIMLSQGKTEELQLPQGPATKAETASEFEKYFGPQRDWPRFRGPAGNGVTTEKGLPTKWNGKTGENVLWSVDVFHPRATYPMHPYASPIVYRDKVFAVLANYKDSIFVNPPKDLKLKVPQNGYELSASLQDSMEFRLVCFNKADGKRLWEAMLEPEAAMGLKGWAPGSHEDENSAAASTPCTDGERVYVVVSGYWGGGGMLAAVDYAGKVVWKQDLKKYVKGQFVWTIGTSPMIYRDTVVMVCITNGSPQGQGATVAFDSKTGAVRYCEPRRERDNYSGAHSVPTSALLRGAPALLISSMHSFDCIDPENGKVAWSANLPKSAVAMDGATLYSVTGLDGRGSAEAAAWSLDGLAGARGDLAKNALWKASLSVGKNGSEGFCGAVPIVAGGYLYCLSWDGMLFCNEVATGKEVYAQKVDDRRWRYPCPFATADGYVYFASSGKSIAVKSGPKFEGAIVSDLGDTNFWGYAIYGYGKGNYDFNSVAVSDGRIFILGHNKLWCIGKR